MVNYEEDQSRLFELLERFEERLPHQPSATAVIRSYLLNYFVRHCIAVRTTNVLLFVGRSEVDKLNAAIAVAEIVFGSSDKLTSIDMSRHEVKDCSSVIRPLLVDPHRVMLLRDVDKAERDLLQTLFGAIDRGIIYDNAGQEVRLSETFFAITTTVGL